MICPRCDSERVHLLVESPVGNVWKVYMCERCHFSWRDTESEDITDPAKYAPKWKLNDEKIAGMMQIPPIPPLKKQ